MITNDEATLGASRIVARLRALGYDLKDGHGYQAVAAYHNFSDWNRMSAAIRRATSGDGKHAKRDRAATAPTNMNTVAEVARNRRTHLLLTTPGGGKSSMLYLRILAELERPQSAFLYVDMSGGGSRDVPGRLRTGTVTVGVTLSQDGAHGVRVRGEAVSGDLRGAFVEMLDPAARFPDFSPERSRALGDALSRLPQLLASVLPREFLERVSLVCFDEAHRLRGEEERQFFDSTVPLFETGGADIVVAGQIFPVTAYSDALFRRALPQVIADRRIIDFYLKYREESFSVASLEELVQKPPSLDDSNTLMEGIAAAVASRLGYGDGVGAGWSTSNLPGHLAKMLDEMGAEAARRKKVIEEAVEAANVAATRELSRVALRGFAPPAYEGKGGGVSGVVEPLPATADAFIQRVQAEIGRLPPVETAGDDVWRKRLAEMCAAVAPVAWFLQEQGCVNLHRDGFTSLLRLDKLDGLVRHGRWAGDGAERRLSGPAFEDAVAPLRTYLSTVPGYDPASQGDQPEKAVEHHGYLTMMTTRLLAR